MSALQPRESADFIVEHAKYVKISHKHIKYFADYISEDIQNQTIDPTYYANYELYPKKCDSQTVEWIFVVHLLCFGLWVPKNWRYGKPEVRLRPCNIRINNRRGTSAICEAINRALSEGIQITDANFYEQIDEETLKHILRPDSGYKKLSLMSERVDILREVGKCLVDKWQGKFTNMVRASGNSAIKLLELMLRDIPHFRDEADFLGKRISFNKKAQSIVADLWVIFNGEDFGAFADIQNITSMPSYRSAQSLVYSCCMRYKPELWEAVKSDTILESGHVYDTEIMGASIFIAEKLKELVNQRFQQQKIDSIFIDCFLYQYRRDHGRETAFIHYHKVINTHL